MTLFLISKLFAYISPSDSSTDFWYTRVQILYWFKDRRLCWALECFWLMPSLLYLSSNYKVKQKKWEQSNCGSLVEIQREFVFLSSQAVLSAVPLGIHIITLLTTEFIISWEIALTSSPKCAASLRGFHTLMYPQRMNTEEPTPKSLMWSQCKWKSMATIYLCWKTGKWM